MSEAQTNSVKDAVNAIIQSLPNDVTWDEVQYRLFVRQQIEAGLADCDVGRLIDTDEMRLRLIERKKTN